MIVGLLPLFALICAMPAFGWFFFSYKIGRHLRAIHPTHYRRLVWPNLLMIATNPLTFVLFGVFVLGGRDRHLDDAELHRLCRNARRMAYAHAIELLVLMSGMAALLHWMPRSS